jgi:protein involved in polysaccharide export with SLBB domain
MVSRLRTRVAGIATAALVLMALAVPWAPLVQAQTTAPTAAQIEAYKSLPPEQQKAILQQFQKSGGARAGTQQKKLESSAPVIAEPQKQLTAAEEQAALAALREPRLSAGDTVIVEVAIRAPGEDDLAQSIAEDKRRKDLEKAQAQAKAADTTKQGELTPPATTREKRKALEEQRRLERTPERVEELEKLRDRIRAGNPYKLDQSGTLYLPGVAGVPLAGLTQEQARLRLANDPALRDFLLRVTLLPLERQGTEALKPFGYDLFTTLPSTYAPVSDVPVPSEYSVGPGDTIEVQLLGNTQAEHSLTVGRDGTIQFPDLGPIAVAGLTFPQARQAIEERVSREMIGTRAVVSIGELRSITVFITGEAEAPGSYTVSALSTITNALFASGGIKEIGSLRNVQLKRRGRLVATLDLYDLLMRGDSSDDLRLVSGDVIFVPPVGPTAGITGEIRRPAIYELKGESKASDLLYLAGGLLPDADPKTATIERINESRVRAVVDVDLTTPSGRATPLRSGDVMRLGAVRPQLANAVTLNGNVYRPGAIAWRQGLRIADVLPRAEDLKPGSDLHYVLVRRETLDHQVSTVSADLEKAWREPASDANVPLMPRDQLYVFDLEGGRELQLRPVLDDLRQQAVMGAPAQTVGVGGRVRAPGQYPLEVDMTVSDLVRAGAGLGEAAYSAEAELTRYAIVNGQYRESATLQVNLAAALAGDPAADLVLQPFDFLVIKELPQWTEQGTITVGGEVRFPGTYPIRRGETLSSVLKRAGGLTDLAFAEGAVFTRKSLREREAAQIATLADRLQGDLASLALQATQSVMPSGAQQPATQALIVGQTLLDNLREVEPVGRLVINLGKIMAAAPGSHDDVVVKDGDRLLVPGQMQEVTVLGEVQSSTSHLWDPEFSREDYIEMSGGTTQNADKGRIYVVRANGSVVSGDSNVWFSNRKDGVRPGDTIVVPLDAQRMRPLPLWTAVTTIIYNLAVAVAAVNSF